MSKRINAGSLLVAAEAVVPLAKAGEKRWVDVALLKRCEAMLSAYQWCHMDWSECPECKADRDKDAHAATCLLAALLADLRKELGV